MYQALLLGRGMNKVLEAFYKDKKRTFYFLELKRITKLSEPALLHNLRKLIRLKLLKSEKTKSNTFYALNPKSPQLWTILACYDISRFEALDADVKQPLKDLLRMLEIIPAFVLLYGSASEGKQREGSDIDILLVIGDDDCESAKKHVQDVVKKVSAASIYPINAFFTTLDVFERNLKLEEDVVLVQAHETGFPITGFEGYYAAVFDDARKA